MGALPDKAMCLSLMVLKVRGGPVLRGRTLTEGMTQVEEYTTSAFFYMAEVIL